MKKNLLIFFVTLIISCGSNENKKKGFEYNRTKKRENKKYNAEESSTPIDLKNKGLGPIKEANFKEFIDQDLANKGASSFNRKCIACHMAGRKLIGPAMKGIYDRRSPEWVMNMILNPVEMLKKDPIAVALLKEYNNIMMLNQNITKDEARSISEYLRTL